MSRIADKPGRKISLNIIYDYDRQLVQIIRNLSNTKGFLVDSGNIGFMPMKEWEAFLARECVRVKGKEATLIEQFGLP